MRLLHICNGYTSSKLYDELFTRFANFEVDQTVIAPNLKTNDLGIMSDKYQVHRIERNTSIIKRLQFQRKIKSLFNYITDNIDCKFDLIHAHTLFSDGFVAYKMFEKFGIPYIIAVRSSDMCFFYRYYIHLRKHAYKVLEKASAIIFISPSYKHLAYDLLPDSVLEKIKNKTYILPNGISDIWFHNRIKKNKNLNMPTNLIFCGLIKKRKNIELIINAVRECNRNGNQVTLTIIGKKKGQNDKYCRKIEQMARNSKCEIIVMERKSPGELIDLYSSSDIFIMPSVRETFGLVYVEALTQGLPVIFSKDEGFDGFYPEDYIGKSVNPERVDNIVKAIKYCIDNYSLLTSHINSDDSINRFNWNIVTKEYINLYNKIIKKFE